MAALALLAGADALAAEPIAKRAEACFACHGAGGHSQTALTPSIAAQPAFFTVAQLFLFRDNRRGKTPTPMYEIAKGMSNEDLRAYADYFAKLAPPPVPAPAPDAARFARGRAVAQQHHCASCHNPDFTGREQMPRLANQREDYLLKSMRDYKSGARVGYSRGMEETLVPLADADLADVAHFLAHFPAPQKPR
ncbi:MAG: c-type cytochrome [Burkholderiales bacterium]|nr:c-type cytochrome [Burkholderiales bacterium]